MFSFVSQWGYLAQLLTGYYKLLSGEHSNTERGYLTKVLKPHLEKLLREDGSDEAVEVVVSSIDRDPLDIV